MKPLLKAKISSHIWEEIRQNQSWDHQTLLTIKLKSSIVKDYQDSIALQAHYNYPWEFLLACLSLLLWGNEKWVPYFCQDQKLVPLAGQVHSPDITCHFMLFVEEPIWETVGHGKQGSWTHRSPLLRPLSWNTGKASGSQNLPSLKITAFPTQKASSPPW
jgi:hypothetical protein